MNTNGLSAEALKVLRDCRLLDHCNDTSTGVSFVRCGRNLGPSGAHEIAAEIRNKLGDTGVYASFNGDTGHNDYIRVNRGTKAFALICYMKS